MDAFEGEDLGRRPPDPFWRAVDKQAVKLARKVEKRRKPITERKPRQLELFGEGLDRDEISVDENEAPVCP